jgi:hypothetical protein
MGPLLETCPCAMNGAEIDEATRGASRSAYADQSVLRGLRIRKCRTTQSCKVPALISLNNGETNGTDTLIVGRRFLSASRETLSWVSEARIRPLGSRPVSRIRSDGHSREAAVHDIKDHVAQQLARCAASGTRNIALICEHRDIEPAPFCDPDVTADVADTETYCAASVGPRSKWHWECGAAPSLLGGNRERSPSGHERKSLRRPDGQSTSADA